MHLTFQVPIQYCSLQKQTFLSPPDTSKTKHSFHFGPATSFFLELLISALCSSPVACWTFPNPGGSSPSLMPFCLFILCTGFSRQEPWSALPFPPPVDHVLSEFFTMSHLSGVVLHDTAHSFTELHKPLQHNKAVIHERSFDIRTCQNTKYVHQIPRVFRLFWSSSIPPFTSALSNH